MKRRAAKILLHCYVAGVPDREPLDLNVTVGNMTGGSFMELIYNVMTAIVC